MPKVTVSGRVGTRTLTPGGAPPPPWFCVPCVQHLILLLRQISQPCSTPPQANTALSIPRGAPKPPPVPGSPGPTWMNIPMAPRWTHVRLSSWPRGCVFEAHCGPSATVSQDAGQGRCSLTRSGLTPGGPEQADLQCRGRGKGGKGPQGILESWWTLSTQSAPQGN